MLTDFQLFFSQKFDFTVLAYSTSGSELLLLYNNESERLFFEVTVNKLGKKRESGLQGYVCILTVILKKSLKGL